MHLRSLLIVAVVVASVLQTGCGASTADVPTGTAPHVPKVLAKVPAPQGEVALRLSPVAASNRSKGVAAFDFQTLDGLAKTDVTIREPFLKRDVRFTGVPMTDLLRIVGASSTAKRIDMHALDDYAVKLTVDDLVSSEALLATRADGKPIPLAKGGPIRIVFLADTKTARNTDMWIWSVDHMKLIG